MKILFTGGATGGHFYPVIAVAEAINEIVRERKLLEPELYFAAPEPFDERALFENGITFKKSPAGKLRRYFSVWNVFDLFKTAIGILRSVIHIFFIYPDVVFSKGGYTSFPVVFAARLLRIPVIIHESDATAGRVNKWAGKFARRVAVSFPKAATDFPEEKVAYVGNPVRKALFRPVHEGAFEFLQLEEEVPVLLILGGSQGAERINNAVLDALPELTESYQIVHQTGSDHIKMVENTANVVLSDEDRRLRYKPFPYLNALAMRMAAGAADLVISRAGAGAIYEVAAWQLPSIMIPIPEDVSHDQRTNAYAYAQTGAAIVLEEKNLTPHLLASEVQRLFSESGQLTKMRDAAAEFARPNAAKDIAEEILSIALSHES